MLPYDLRFVARRVRDSQWEFMERLARYGFLHVCPWCKNRSSHAQPNELIFGLLDYMEFAHWLTKHPSWFRHGAWDNRRQTRAYWLTAAGRTAVKRRDRREDGLPVSGGLVEPGWRASPRTFWRSLREQREQVLTVARGFRPTRVCSGEILPPRADKPLFQSKRRRRKAA